MLLTEDEIIALHLADMAGAVDLWEQYERTYGPSVRADLGRVDRFYLLTVLLHRPDALHPWLYERCREVERDPDGYLDLWAREHYKSTVITFAGIIQEMVRDPEITIAIFSHTKPVARKFLLQIKQELETNVELITVYPEVFYVDPRKESPKWSEEKGIVIRRKSNPKEATLEGHGLVDGQPTGAHYILRVYDDVVTLESVSTPEQVAKTTAAWELSDNLGARAEGMDHQRAWHVGTRYSFADSYNDIIERKALIPRLYPATHNGLPDGDPVLLSRAAWEDKKLKQGPATIACQMLQNPAAGNEAMFSKDWLSFMDIRPSTLNVYIMCDPASSKKKGSDNTAISVIGVDAAMNFWLLDGYRHKMNLRERWLALRNMRRKWLTRPGVQLVKVGYEKYGMQSDMEYFEMEMQREQDAWEVVELNWVLEGAQSKNDRVQRLVPKFLQRQFHMAMVCIKEDPATGKMVPYKTANQLKMEQEGKGFRVFEPVKQRDHENNLYSLNKGFLDEYLFFPFSSKKDLIDATARIYDMDPVAPIIIDQSTLEPATYVDGL